jgi:N-acyl-D-aspartate/D-glutamate deacylase
MTLLIHNATLIDGTGVDPRPGVSVLVEDGRIASIAPADGQEKAGIQGAASPLSGVSGGVP